MNNPLVYKDADGEIAWFVPIIVGAVTGGITNTVANHRHIDSFWAGAGYFGVGAVAGAAGVYAGGAVACAVGTIGFLGGALTGSAAGFSSGLVAGSGNAWMNGSNFGDGLMFGFRDGVIEGLIGGVIGGFSGGITAVRHSGNFWTGKGTTFHYYLASENNTVTVGKGMEYSNEYAGKFSDDYFGEVEGLDNLYADGTIPNGVTKSGDFVFHKGSKVSGLTVYNGIGKGSNVYLYKNAFTSMEKLYLVMGHEYIHVYFNYGGTNSNIVSQERVAYKWNVNQAKAWKMDYSYYEKMHNYFLNKPGEVQYPYGLRAGFQPIRKEIPW
jgi:hypothetical protein